MNRFIQLIEKDKMKFVLGGLFLCLILFESEQVGDFDIYMQASKDLLEGQNIYKNTYHQYYFYYYDVFFALLITPLKLLPLYWCNFIWLLLNLFFTFRIVQVSLYFLPLEEFTKKQKQVIAVVSFCFIFALWFKNIHVTQLTIFILFLCLEGIYRIMNKKTILGAMLIGMGISIKLLPILLIPYLIYRGYFWAVIFVFLSIVLFMFLPSVFIGYQHNLFLLQERWSLINPFNTEHILDVSERSFHSLTTFLSVLLVQDTGNSYSLTMKRNILDIELSNLSLVINVARTVLVLGGLWILKSIPFRKSKDYIQVYYELSYLFLITPLIFPHQQHYAFFFIFPAVFYLVFYNVKMYATASKTYSRSKIWSIIVISMLIFFLLNSHFVLGAFRNYYDHFKTLTYGVLLVLIFLVFSNPRKLKLNDLTSRKND